MAHGHVFCTLALSFMMRIYAMVRRRHGFVLARGWALSSVHGFLAGTWSFGVVDAIRALIAPERFARHAPAAV